MENDKGFLMGADENQGQADEAGRQNIEDDLQREIAAALGDASLEDLMAETAAPHGREDEPAGEGGTDLVTGTVAGVSGDDIFVELADMRQGVIAADQFEGEPLPEVDEKLQLQIHGYDDRDDLVLLSRQGKPIEAAWDTLGAGQIVEGRVTGTNKGGLELDVDGIRAFMPVSQIERFRVEDTSGYVNQKLRCQVLDVDKAKRNVIVSQRAILDAEAEDARQELFDSLTEGKVVEGLVKSVMQYGAFVDIGGADGLLHISDMSHTRVNKCEDVVQVGQRIQVMVLKFDRAGGKISLGLKQVLPDPWADVADKYRPDEIVTGRVRQLAEFGAFVELEAGMDGLVPIGELTYGRRIRHPKEVIAEGDTVQVRVLKVEPERRRISLSVKRVGEDPWVGATVRWPVGSIANGLVTRITDFGAFVELAPGVEGLVHISELSDGRVRSASDVVGEAETVGVKVLSVDEEARRIALSIKQVAAGSPAEADSPQPEAPPSNRKRPLKGGLE